MPQVILGIGIQPDGTPVNLYIGDDAVAAETAVDTAGLAGSINLGYIYENPPVTTTFRYSGAGSSSAPAPTITALNPNTTAANSTVNLDITGTNFDPATVVVLFGTSQLTPTGTPTDTDLNVLIPSAEVASAGVIQVKVQNGDGQQSNSLDFTVT